MQDGHHTLTLYANDSTGNMYSSSVSFTVDTQRIPPAISFGNPTPTNNSWKNTNWIYVNTTVEDSISDISSVILQWDNGTLTNFSMQCNSGSRVVCSRNITNLPDDIYTFKIFANDSAGNGNWSAERHVKLDATPPRFAILSPSNATYAESSIEFNFSVAEANIEWIGYSIDGNANISSNANASFYGLADGTHTIALYANDSAGNTNLSIVYFTIDTKPPIVAVRSPTNNTIYNVSFIWINVTLDAPGSAVIAERDGVENNSLTNSSGNWNYLWTGLADGFRDFEIYANDTAGNVNVSVKLRIKIDTKAPKIYFNPRTPADTTITNNASFVVNVTVEGDDVDTALLYVNDTAYAMTQQSASPGVYYYNRTHVQSADGNYRYYVFVNDTAGNTNRTDTRIIVKDATPPLIIIDSPMNASLNDATPLLNATFSGESVNATWYSMDGGVNSTPAMGVSNLTIVLSTLAEGPHSLSIYANDSAGNTNSSIVRFTIDTKPPNASFAAPTPQNDTWVNKRWVYINVTLEDATSNVGSVMARWDDGVPANYPMNCTIGKSIQCGKNFTGLSDGEYSYKIFANDSVGNGNWNLERRVRVDATRPSLSLLSPENITYNTASIELNFSAIEANRDWVGYSLDDAPNVSLSGNAIITNLTEGTHTIAVYANDSAGNLDSTAVNFAVDTIAPYSVELHLPADQNLSRDWVLLNWTASDATTELSYLIRLEDAEDGWTLAVRSANASPYNLTDLVNGKYTVRILALDAAGNSNSSAKNLTIDLTPPVLQSPTASPDPATPGSNVTLGVKAQDAVSGVQSVEANVTLPNGSVVNRGLQFLGGNWSATIAGDDTGQIGSYDVVFVAVDYAGNSRTSSLYSFDVKAATTNDSRRSVIIGVGGGGGGGGAPVVASSEGGSSHFRSECIKRGLQVLNSSLLACAIKEMNLSGKNFYSVPRILVPALALTGDKTGDYPLPEMNASISGGSILRLEWDPYEVAAKTALAKWNSTEELVIARGDIEADAYAAIGYARAMNYPLLLAKPDELPSATQEALGKLRPKTVILVGGEAVFSNAFRWELRKMYAVPRYWGLGREDTAVDVAWWIKSDTHRDVENVIIDDGSKPTAGSAFVSALYGIPILYAFDGKVPDATKEFLARHNATDEEGHTLGIVFAGEGVKAMGEVRALLGVG